VDRWEELGVGLLQATASAQVSSGVSDTRQKIMHSRANTQVLKTRSSRLLTSIPLDSQHRGVRTANTPTCMFFFLRCMNINVRRAVKRSERNLTFESSFLGRHFCAPLEQVIRRHEV
jgi:hypothetical protein